MLWPLTYLNKKQIMKYTWLVSYYFWTYASFITLIAPLWVMIALILYGAEKRGESNSVTAEVATTILIYLGYEAASIWFVWKYTPYAAFYYEWDKYETDEDLIAHEK